MSKKTGVIAGAFVPHAPQMLSLPKTEDAAQVARVREAMASIGQKFRELKPDLVVEVLQRPWGRLFHSISAAIHYSLRQSRRGTRRTPRLVEIAWRSWL